MSRRKAIVFLAVALVGALTGTWLGGALIGRGTPPELAGGTLLNPPKPLAPFKLIDHEGRAFELEQLRGQWTLAFFGYTHCPDVCPNTLGILNAAVNALKKQRPRVLRDTQVVFVSVDPERDTPEQLANYLPYFNEAFIGVTGPQDQLEALTRPLGVAYSRSEDGPEGEYFMDHTASIVLFDKQARFSAIFFPPHTAVNLASDLQRVRWYYGE